MRRPTLVWEPSCCQVCQRPVHADDRCIYGRLPILKNFLGTHLFPGSTGTLPTHHTITMTVASPTTTHPTHPSLHSLHSTPCFRLPTTLLLAYRVPLHDRYSLLSPLALQSCKCMTTMCPLRHTTLPWCPHGHDAYTPLCSQN
jgi:hypothetical protein